MSKTVFKDIRVLPSQLDFRKNTDKTLEKILVQLQSGLNHSTATAGKIQGQNISIIMPDGELLIPNNAKLKTGDIIDLTLSVEGLKIKGTITKINNSTTLSAASSEFYLSKTRPLSKENSHSNTKPVIKVTLNHINSLPKQVSGSISYLNLSQINNQSAIYSLLSSIKQGDSDIPITFNISHTQNNESLNQINAEVLSNEKDETQLLRTEFGIITSKTTSLPIGHKLFLEIVAINGQNVENNITNLVTRLMFKIRENWYLLSKLKSTMRKHDLNNKMELALSLISDKKFRATIEELSAELKEIRSWTTKLPFSPNNDSIAIPFYHNEQMEYYKTEAYLKQTEREIFLHFGINVTSHNIFGTIKIEGTVTLRQNKTPKTMNLVIKSEKPFDENLQTRIYEILSSTKISDLKTSITFASID